jgi:hypothetical protein
MLEQGLVLGHLVVLRGRKNDLEERAGRHVAMLDDGRGGAVKHCATMEPVTTLCRRAHPWDPAMTLSDLAPKAVRSR